MARVYRLCLGTVLVLTALLAPGCVTADVPPSADDSAPGLSLTDASLPECEVVLSPEPDLEAETGSAARRWSVATGCDIHIGEGGLPIRSEAYVYDPDATRMCGLATWDDARVAVQHVEVAMVDVACLPAYTVLHELCHALSGIQGHTLSGVCASGTSKDKSTRIDEPSLQLVCYGLHCSRFAPEPS
jgi:hypothetical protein